jgi:hypothetical protein
VPAAQHRHGSVQTPAASSSGAALAVPLCQAVCTLHFSYLLLLLLGLELTGYVLIQPRCIDQLSPAPQSVHTDAPVVLEYLPAHQRQGSVRALALVPALLRHRKVACISLVHRYASGWGMARGVIKSAALYARCLYILVEHPVLTKLTYIRFAHSRPGISRLTRGTCRAREGARLGNQNQSIAGIDSVR